MRWIKVAPVMVLLFQTSYVPCSAEEAVILKGDEIALHKFIIGEFVEAVFYTEKGKKETARGYIKSVEGSALTIGSGLWETKIPYSNILTLRLSGPPVTIGSRVRIAAPHQFTGELVSVATDTIVLKPEYGSVLVFPRTSITNLEVRRGTRALLGGVIGFFGGGLLGVSLYAQTVDSGDRGGFGPYGDELRRFGIVTILSGGAGALIGANVGRRLQNWQKVPLNRLGVGVSLQHDGGLALSTRFAF